MVSMFIELPINVYEWFDQMSQKASFDSVNDYLAFILKSKCAEATRGGREGGFIYADNENNT